MPVTFLERVKFKLHAKGERWDEFVVTFQSHCMGTIYVSVPLITIDYPIFVAYCVCVWGCLPLFLNIFSFTLNITEPSLSSHLQIFKLHG